MHTFAELLETRRDALLQRWLLRVRREFAPDPGLDTPALADHIPQFLEQLAVALRREAEGEAPRPHRLKPLGWEHGRQRLVHGFDLRAMVQEYGALHEELLALADEEGVRMDPDELRVLVQGFTHAVAEAVSHFVRDAQAEGAEDVRAPSAPPPSTPPH
jgi:hypothetical protein